MLTIANITSHNKEIAHRITKSNGIAFQTMKNFKEVSGLKGQALKRAHFAYRLEFGKLMNVQISSLIASGEIIADCANPTEKGMKVSFSRVGTLNAPKEGKVSIEAIATKLVEKGLFNSLELAIAALS